MGSKPLKQNFAETISMMLTTDLADELIEKLLDHMKFAGLTDEQIDAVLGDHDE